MAARKLGFSALMPVALLGLALAYPLSAGAKSPALSVEAAWLRLPSASGRPAAGYFELKGGANADALIGAASPKAQRVELHSMTMTEGVMRMRAESSFAVPASTSLSFAPGGNHLMLFGLDPSVKAGDRVPLTLSFKSGAKLQTTAEVRAVNAPEKPVDGGHKH